MSDEYRNAGEGSPETAVGPAAVPSLATTVQPDTAVPDLENCLVVVASYASSATLVESVAAEAAQRVMLSPVLAAFIDLRFVHLGPATERGERSPALSRITSQLLQPRPGTGRSFFSVVVLDKLATAAEAVLRDCAASPFLDELPLQLRGIASIEDRATVSGPHGSEILVSPKGKWQREELVRELRRYADELLHELAGARQEGVNSARLTELHDHYRSHAAQERAVIARTETAIASFPTNPDPTLGNGDGAGDQPGPTPAPPAPDALDPVAAPAELAPEPAPTLVAPVPPEAVRNDSAPQESARQQPEETTRTMMPAISGPAASPADDGEAEPTGAGAVARPMLREALPRLSHLLPQVRWPHPARGAGGTADRLEPTTTGLVYLLLTGDENIGDRDEWSRARTVMLEVDRTLAALPQVACNVRVLHGNEQELRGDLRQAGQLRKRDLRGAVADLYFADVLPEIGKVLRRDQGNCGAPDRPLNRPAVVFIAPEPPLADSAAVECLRALATEASVAWVVPRSQVDLISDSFKGLGSVLTDFETLADDVAALVTPDASAPADPSPAAIRPQPGPAPDGEDPGSAPGTEVAAVGPSPR